MAWDTVEDTITMARWHAYEEEWKQQPTLEDFAVGYFDYKPIAASPKGFTPTPTSDTTMGPADFLRFVKQTGGKQLGPS